MGDYPLDHFLSDLAFVLSAVEREDEVLQAVGPLAQKLAASLPRYPEADFDWDETHGTGDLELHRPADEGPCIGLGAWRPGSDVPPRDYGTWSVLVGIDGSTRITLWRRTDDGAAPGRAAIESAEVRTLAPGEALSLGAEAIHSVANIGEETAYTLHVTGRDPEETGRRQYDPEAGSVKTVARDLD